MADDRATHRALIAQLREEDAFIEFPAEAEASWSLEDIQTYYDTCGEIVPESTALKEEGSEQVQAEPSNEATVAGTVPAQLDAMGTEPGASLEEMRAELKQKLLAAAALAEKHRALAEALDGQQQRLAVLDPPAPTDLANQLMAPSNLGGLVEQPPPITGSFPVGGWKARNPQDMTSAAYREEAVAAGIPFRPHGLFGPADADALREMAARPGAAAFQKHLWDLDAQRWAIATDTWATGDQASAQRGIDLRYFHIGRELHGLLRYSAKATIGAELLMSAHGGAVESVLDEATAELMKIQHSPNTVTRKFTASILKPVPAFETLAVCCTYTKEMAGGVVVVIEGVIKDSKGALLARAIAEMVDLSKM
eukprot:COSAG02_NODE_1288_length_13447_cov_17.387549_9_plen_366_part_00